MLEHVPAREAAFARIVRAVKPGRSIVVEDFEAGTLRPDPAAYRGEQPIAAYALMHEVLAECGVDLRYGRRLPGLMRAAGLVECGAEGRVFIHQPHSPGLRMGSMGRVLAPQLSDQLVQQAIVENRAGVSGNIGAEAVAKAPGDDYTLLLSALTSYSINYSLERQHQV